jgi:hypothetical protein
MNFFDVEDTYTKTSLVFGLNKTDFRADDGKVYDNTKVTIYAEMSGDNSFGGTCTQLLWGTKTNFDQAIAKGLVFPAICQLTVRKSAKKLGQEAEEVVELKYMQPVKVVPAQENKKAA